MPSITLHTSTTSPSSSSPNPLPPFLHTPLGLAILEIQGTLNLPPLASTSEDTLQIGSLSFPLAASSGDGGASEGPWMKKVWLYVGQNQRLTGEVRKLAKPLGVMRKRRSGEEAHDEEEELEIVDVVRWKVFFGGRPEFV